MMIMDALIIILKNTNTILAASRAIYTANCHVGTGPLFQCCRNSMDGDPVCSMHQNKTFDYCHY